MGWGCGNGGRSWIIIIIILVLLFGLNDDSISL